MKNFVARSFLLLLLASFSLMTVDAKSMRRADKISENFKQLDLPPEEIDPNVAPPEPQKLDTVAETPVATATAATAPLIDESINEIGSVDATPAEEVASAVGESASSVAEATPAAAGAAAAPVPAPAPAPASAPAPATTSAVAASKPKPKPTKTPKPTDENPISRYCKCSESHCDCCRKFGLPLLPSGPGCARISYLGNDEMSVSLKFGQITLASRRISSKRARPICVGMPGGYSKFCGRVYGLSQAKENFKACLAFELRAEDEVEAQLPISCFKFGAEGLRVAEAEPLPTKVKKPDDDEDDDIFGFGAGGDDDDDDDDDDEEEEYDGEEPSAEDDDTDYGDDDDEAEAPAEADYGGFSLGGLLDELDDDEDEKPVKKPAVGSTPAVTDQTREQSPDMIQSKDEAGTVAGAGAGAGAGTVAATAATAMPSTEEEAAPTVEVTTTKGSKKSKKAKKNKKKKKANGADSETDYAYEFFNGILDFFN